jgi:hypothetical protein
VTGLSDDLVFVARKRLTASRVYVRSFRRCDPGQVNGYPREAFLPADDAYGAVWRSSGDGIPDACGPHQAQLASVQAQVGPSLASEAAFDAALASRDPAVLQVFDRFYVFQRRMEAEQ